MAASARLIRNCVTGRREVGEVTPIFNPEPVFTPFRGEALDIDQLESQLDRWLEGAALDPIAIASGGALVTGLAARSANAGAVTKIVKNRFQQAVVAATDDPCLESWLAFMGNALGLSRAEPQNPVINLDIGGGTTNIAWGLAGEGRRCGCYYVGARHIQVEPGSYRITSISPFAKALLIEFGMLPEIGAELNPVALAAVLDFYIGVLEAAVTGSPLPPPETISRLHCQAEFHLPVKLPSGPSAPEPIITLSGGVGELAYRAARGDQLSDTTAFGDLGIDFARRICAAPVLARNLGSHVPAGLGRATVNGLAVHSTEVSGATTFLPHPERLPFIDLPILGQIGCATSDDELTTILDLAERAAEGACLRVVLESEERAAVKALGERLAVHLEKREGLTGAPLVLVTAGNIGKTLGQYATRWGRLAAGLIVIDEITSRRAHFASIGKPQNGLIPVSFHGLEAAQ